MNDLLYLHALSLPQGYYTNTFYERNIRYIPFFINDNLKCGLFISNEIFLGIGKDFDKTLSLLEIIKKNILKLPKNRNYDKENNKIFNELTKYEYKKITISVWGDTIILAIRLAERLNRIGYEITINAYGCYPLINKEFVKFYSNEKDFICLIPKIFSSKDVYSLENKILTKPSIIKWLTNFMSYQKIHNINDYYSDSLRNINFDKI